MSKSVRGTSSQRSRQGDVSKQKERQELRKNDAAAKKLDEFVDRTEAMVKGLQDELTAFKSELPTLKTQLQGKQESSDAMVEIIGQLTEKKTNLEDENYKLSIDKQNLKEEIAKLNREKEKGEDRVRKISFELEQTRLELDNTRTRLSEVLGNQLTNSNAAIADLSDKNRPTKLAERFSEIYDNEWTDAYESVKHLTANDEKECVSILLKILKMVNNFCLRKWQSYVEHYHTAITMGKNRPIPDFLHKQLKDVVKILASNMYEDIFEEFLNERIPNVKEENRHLFEPPEIKTYLKACVQICWYMAAQDPPVALKFDAQPGDVFDLYTFRAFTNNGRCIDFVVWPPLFLYDGGELLIKGVAQGFGAERPMTAPPKVNGTSKDRPKPGLSSTLNTNKKQAWAVVETKTKNNKSAQTPTEKKTTFSNNSTQQRTERSKDKESNPTEGEAKMKTTHLSSDLSPSVSDNRAQQTNDPLETFRLRLQQERQSHQPLPELPVLSSIRWNHARTPTQEEIENFQFFLKEKCSEQEMVNLMGSDIFQMCHDYYRYCKDLLENS